MEQDLTIGGLLKSAREQKKVSLEDVSNKTKININILRSLEKDDLESLPNKTYVKGFVKNCAKTLGVDANSALDALERGYKANEPEQSLELVETPISKEPSEAQAKSNKQKELEMVEMQDRLKGILGQLINKKILVGAGAVLVAVLVIKGAVGFFSNINTERESLTTESNATEPADDIKPSEASLFELEGVKNIQPATETPETEKASAQTQPEKEPETAKAVESVKAEVKEEPAKKVANDETEQEKTEETKVAEEKPAVIIPAGKFPFQEFYPAPRNMFTVDAEAEEIKDDNLFPEKYRNAMNSDKHNVFVNAVEGDTWLSYQVDGEDVKRYVLKQGRTLFIQADTEVLLFLGNLNVTKIFYNNQLVNAKSRSGVKSLIFPEEKAADYDLPLFPSYKGVPHRQDVYKKNMLEKPAQE